jgi:hypothetical protein
MHSYTIPHTYTHTLIHSHILLHHTLLHHTLTHSHNHTLGEAAAKQQMEDSVKLARLEGLEGHGECSLLVAQSVNSAVYS